MLATKIIFKQCYCKIAPFWNNSKGTIREQLSEVMCPLGEKNVFNWNGANFAFMWPLRNRLHCDNVTSDRQYLCSCFISRSYIISHLKPELLRKLPLSLQLCRIIMTEQHHQIFTKLITVWFESVCSSVCFFCSSGPMGLMNTPWYVLIN